MVPSEEVDDEESFRIEFRTRIRYQWQPMKASNCIIYEARVYNVVYIPRRVGRASSAVGARQRANPRAHLRDARVRRPVADS